MADPVPIQLPGDEVAAYPHPHSGLEHLVTGLRLAVQLAAAGKGTPRLVLGLLEIAPKTIPAAEQGRTLNRLSDDVASLAEKATGETEDWVALLTWLLGASRRVMGRAVAELLELHTQRQALGETNPRLDAIDSALRDRRRQLVAKGFSVLESLGGLAAALEERSTSLEAFSKIAADLPAKLGECQRILELEMRLVPEQAVETPFSSLAPVLSSLAEKLESYRLASEKVHLQIGQLAGHITDLGSPAVSTPRGPAWFEPVVETVVRFSGDVEELDARIAAIKQALSFDEAAPFVDLSVADAPFSRTSDLFSHVFALGLARVASGAPLERARRIDRPAVWRDFLAFLPPGPLAADIRALIDRFVTEALEKARATGTEGDWEKVREMAQPGSPEAKEAEERCDFLSAASANRPEALRAYLAEHPEGTGAPEARSRLEAVQWIPDWAAGAGTTGEARWADLELAGESLRFRLLAPGSFLLAPAFLKDNGQISCQPLEATLTRGTWIAESPVSLGFWTKVRNGDAGPAKASGSAACCISERDITEWLAALRQKAPQLGARLPSQIEWEACARTGLLQTVPPAGEWCADGALAVGDSVRVDPGGTASGPLVRSLLGGPGSSARFDLVESPPEETRRDGLGFRLAVDAAEVLSHSDPVASFLRPPRDAVFLGDLPPLRRDDDPALQRPAGDAWGSLSILAGRHRTGAFVPLHAPSTAVWAIPPAARRFTAVGAGSVSRRALHRSWAYRLSIDGHVVLETPPLSEHRGGLPIDVAIPVGARELAVSVDSLGDADHDQAVLAWPYFHRDLVSELVQIPEGAIFLGDLEPRDVRVGYDEYRVGRLLEPHHSVRLSGQRIETFLWMHAPAEATWPIPPAALRFTAIGTRVNLDFTRHGTWRFVVAIDGKDVQTTDPLSASPEGVPIDVWLPEGARELTLRVEDLGDSQCDWSVLAVPCFRTTRTEFRPGEAALRAEGGRFVSLRAEGAGRLLAADVSPGPPARFELLEAEPGRVSLRGANGRWVRVAEDGVRLAVDYLVPAKESRFVLAHGGPGQYSLRVPETDSYIAVALSQEPELVLRAAHGEAPPAFAFLGRHGLASRRTALSTPSHDVEPSVRFRFPLERAAWKPAGEDLVTSVGGSTIRLHGADFIETSGRKAIRFDGTTTHAVIDPPPRLDGALTILLRFRLDAAPREGWVSFWLCQSNPELIYVRLCLADGRLAWVAPGGPSLFSRAEIVAGRTFNVAVVAKGSSQSLYLDGELQARGPLRFDSSMQLPLFVGRRFAGEGWSHVAGELEEFLIVDRALEENEHA